MKIGVIQAASQSKKNELLYKCTADAVKKQGHEVINFGCFADETSSFSYIEIAVEVSLLLSGQAVDFIVTGCSSGQGMMLACNSLPDVICGYVENPQDAFLFGRINDGNAVSFPLGLNFGWAGEINLKCTLEKLFEELDKQLMKKALQRSNVIDYILKYGRNKELCSLIERER